MRLAAFATLLVLSATAFAEDKTVAKLTLAPYEVWVTRARAADGGLTLKLIAKGVGPKPQALTLYQGGGDDDGLSDSDLKTVKASPFELPGGQKGVRVDLTFRVPDGKKQDEQTDTMLVGFMGKTRKLVELRTRLAKDRTKICRDSEETALSLDDKGNLVAATVHKGESALGDDDLPLDKNCRGRSGVQKKTYKWADDKFIDPDAATSAPEAPKAKPEGDD
jgi:hypothetical protein